MKRIKYLSLFIVMCMLSQLVTAVSAAGVSKVLPEGIKMALVAGGKVAIFDKQDTVLEKAPYYSGESFMMPAGYVLENYGYEFSGDVWKKGADTVAVSEGSDDIEVNGSKHTMSAAAEKKNDILFMPADALTALGIAYRISSQGLLTTFTGSVIETFDEAIFTRLQGVYVSPNGSDGAAGTPASPYKTLDAARLTAVKYVKEYGIEYPVHIFVMGGKYHFSNTAEFTDDAFTADGYMGLTIENYDENIPEFTGAVELDPAELSPVSDAQTLARVHKNGRGKVASMDLAKAGIGTLNQVPNRFNMIYLNDIEQTNARWPNNGEATVYSVPQENTFTFSEVDPTRWVDAKNAYVFGHFSSWGWEWHFGIIQSVNAQTKTINIKGAESNDVMKTSSVGTGWYAANLLEEIDMPGEWFVDTEAMKLYYYPPYRLKDQKLEITTFTGTILHFNNAKKITIKGINFTKCGQAVNFEGLSINDITVEKCKFSHLQARTAVEFPNGTQVYRVKLIENEAYNLFGRFSYFRCGNLSRIARGECVVRNNHIMLPAQYYKSLGAIGGPYQYENFGCCGAVYEHNVLQDIPGGAAIGSGGTHVRISGNEVINAGKAMSDYGAIYFGKSTTCFDTEVCYNFLHDFNLSNDYNGLYNDDGYSGAYWHHNIVANMHQPGVQAPGFNTRYMWNIAVNCDKTGTIGSRKSFGDSIYYKGPIWTHTNDIVNANEAVYRAEYPEIFEWLERKDGIYYDVCWDSIYFGNVGIGCVHLNDFSELQDYGAKQMERGGKTISIDGMNGQRAGNPYYEYSDDIFVDVAHQNYNINPESQVAKDFPELLEADVAKSGLTDEALYLMEKPEHGSHLRYPMNGQKGINASEITFSWDPVKGASFYELIVATDPALENVIYDEEIRENGSFNQLTLRNFANDRVYYWKVVAKSLARQNQFEIDSLGGPYAFKTALRDTLSKENLNLAITSFEAFCRNDLHDDHFEFDAEFVQMAEAKLAEVKNTYRTAMTQAELDKAEEEIYYIVKKSPFYMKLHFENINGAYDKNAKWETNGNISVADDGTLTFSSAQGSRADAKVAIKNRNSILCFKMKLEDLGTKDGDYQGFDIKLNENGFGYLIVFKKNIIEWQRINRTLTVIPNDFIESDKWYDVQAGGINTPNGVLQFFRVDGRIIYAELDQTADQTRDEGYFRMRKNALGTIMIKDIETVPADGTIIDDILKDFAHPHSDKHLQTLFIGSADAMEMSSSKLFVSLDKSVLANVVYPLVSDKDINISRNDISEYKKLLEEACIIAGYNQGLADLLLVNKTEFMYKDVIGIDDIDTNGVTIYAGYKTMTDKFKAAATELMMRSDCKTIDELRRHIAECMLAGTINACKTGFSAQSDYISNVLTKENADYIGIDISDYLALSPEKKLVANDIIGNRKGSAVERRIDELVEDIHAAVAEVK